MYVSLPFPVVDLRFLDYAAISILMALLYLASTLELLAATASKNTLPLANELSLQKAATWSIVGIALTLVAGLVAGANTLSMAAAGSAGALPVSPAASAAMLAGSTSNVSFADLFLEYGGLLVPAFVLAKWWAYHMRGSRIVNLDLIAQELDDSYRREILKDLELRPTMRATKDEVFLACSKRLIASRLVSGLGASFGVAGYLVRMASIETVDKLTFTYPKMEALLAELERENKLSVNDNLIVLRGAPPPPPAISSIPPGPTVA